jgi:hypothetical protein
MSTEYPTPGLHLCWSNTHGILPQMPNTRTCSLHAPTLHDRHYRPVVSRGISRGWTACEEPSVGLRARSSLGSTTDIPTTHAPSKSVLLPVLQRTRYIRRVPRCTLCRTALLWLACWNLAAPPGSPPVAPWYQAARLSNSKSSMTTYVPSGTSGRSTLHAGLAGIGARILR